MRLALYVKAAREPLKEDLRQALANLAEDARCNYTVPLRLLLYIFVRFQFGGKVVLMRGKMSWHGELWLPADGIPQAHRSNFCLMATKHNRQSMNISSPSHQSLLLRPFLAAEHLRRLEAE